MTKPFHIDDPMFLWAARHIQSHPLDFYGSRVNWYGFESSMAETMKNPPLACFYLAAVAFLFGWSETALHGAFFVAALAGVAGTFVLARRLGAPPVPAALSTLAMPAFFVSSTSLMPEVPMLTLWVWCVVFWLRGVDSGRAGWLCGAGVLAGLAAVTDYLGASLVPLLAAHSLARRDGSQWRLACLALPLLLLGAYQLVLYVQYDQNLLTDLVGYASGARSSTGAGGAGQVLVAAIFLGGGLLVPLVYAPWLWQRRALAIWGAIALLLLLLLSNLPTLGGASLRTTLGEVRWSVVLHATLFGTIGLMTLALAVVELHERRDADALLLALWILGVFVFAAVVNWTVSIRALLPTAPAVAVLVWRRLAAPRAEAERSSRVRPELLACVLAVSLTVAWSDERLAESARQAARHLSAKYAQPGRRVWFEGGWSFQYYMEQEGARRIAFGRDYLAAGDVVILPTNNTNLIPLPADHLRLVLTAEVPVACCAASMSPELGAGFYTSLWGPLPYAIGPPPSEFYRVYELTKPLDLSGVPIPRGL